MMFQRAQRGFVAIGGKALAILVRYRQIQASALEAGGVLLGRRIEGADDIIVDDATLPGETDRFGRFFFRRARWRTQEQIKQAWHESRGTRNYLGEWHTHPEDDPCPSLVDLANWRRIVATAHYEQESLLFVIVGRVQVRVWEVAKANGSVVSLDAVAADR